MNKNRGKTVQGRDITPLLQIVTKQYVMVQQIINKLRIYGALEPPDFFVFVQCVRVVQLNCVKLKVQCMA